MRRPTLSLGHNIVGIVHSTFGWDLTPVFINWKQGEEKFSWIMLDILKFGMSLEIFKILCVLYAYLNILPVLVNDKKIRNIFMLTWDLIFSDFGCTWQVGWYLWVRTGESQQQQPVVTVLLCSAGGPPPPPPPLASPPVLQHRQSCQHPPPANILNSSSSPVRVRSGTACTPAQS